MITTKRLLLRPFLESDGEALFQYLSLEEVVKYEPYPVYSLVDAMQEAKERSTNPAFLAVCLQSTNQLIGNIYFALDGPKHLKTYTLGYVFHPAFHNQGYATEAAQAVLEYGFQTLGLHRIVAYCHQENVRSWKLLERLNMRREAAMKENIYFKLDQNLQPIWVDSYQYAILHHEFSRGDAL